MALDKGGDYMRILAEQRVALAEQREVIAEREVFIAQLLAEREMLLHLAHAQAPHRTALLCGHCATAVVWDVP